MKGAPVIVALGASGNLGLACTRRFRDDGARVVAVDRSPERLESNYGDWETERHMLVGGVDLTSDEAVTQLVADIVERFGRIDGVVNTVGMFRAGSPVQEEPPETWELLMRVNLMPAILVARAAIPTMHRQGNGRIVNIASRAAWAGAANMAAYSASKAALLRLTESLAEEVRGQDITVNCVVPGTIDTPQNRQAMPDADTRSWVTPEAIADVIAFLMTPSARAVTGAAIPL